MQFSTIRRRAAPACCCCRRLARRHATTTQRPCYAQDREFDQIQRLGNPLVSEVLLAQGEPSASTARPGPTETASGSRPRSYRSSPAPAAWPDARESYANALGSVLLPDMLIVQTDKDPASAGWLTWLPLAPSAAAGADGSCRTTSMDLALLALFGDPFGADPPGAEGKGGTDDRQRRQRLAGPVHVPYVGNPAN